MAAVNPRALWPVVATEIRKTQTNAFRSQQSEAKGDEWGYGHRNDLIQESLISLKIKNTVLAL